MFWIEAKVHAREDEKAAQKQARSNQQQNGKCNLADDQSVAKSSAPAPFTSAFAAARELRL